MTNKVNKSIFWTTYAVVFSILMFVGSFVGWIPLSPIIAGIPLALVGLYAIIKRWGVPLLLFLFYKVCTWLDEFEKYQRGDK